MYNIQKLRKLNRLFYLQIDVFVGVIALGLYAFLEPNWIKYSIVLLGLVLYGIVRFSGIRSGTKVREGGHKQESQYRGKRLYDMPKALEEENVYLYASNEDGFPKGITFLKVFQALILLCFVVMYYVDLNNALGWKITLIHGCFIIGWSIWIRKVHKDLEKQSSLFIDRGIWFRGRLLPYEQVKRYQVIPMKGGLRFELNTGSYFAAFRIEKDQETALYEIVDKMLNPSGFSVKIEA